MRAAILSLLIISLTGCVGIPSTPLMPYATETIAAAQTRIYAPTEEATPEFMAEKLPPQTPTIDPVNTTPVACLPSEVDFCVEEGHFLLSRPISPPGNDDIEPAYRYGATQNGLREPHHGVEFPNFFGTSVLAAADGQVVFAGSDSDSQLSPWPNFYGNAVVIRHVFGDEVLYTLYGHLSTINVDDGQPVTAGQKIGEVGATGAAIGNHLHFEVRLGDNSYTSTRNPELWLVPKSGSGALAVRVTGKYDTLLSIKLNLQKVLSDGSLMSITQPEAYDFKEKYPISSDDPFGENIALEDLTAGEYRLTFVMLGKLYERFVQVEAGKLTLVYFKIQ